MVDYYKILNVSMQKKKGTLTDEMVEKNYIAKKEQYLKMKKNKDKMENIDSVELQAILDGGYLDLLENAYYALKTENARLHYDELYASIEEYEKELEKVKNEEKRRQAIQQAEQEEKRRRAIQAEQEERRKQAIQAEQEQRRRRVMQAEQEERRRRAMQAEQEERRKRAMRAAQDENGRQSTKIIQLEKRRKIIQEEKRRQAMQEEKNPIQKILNIINNDGLPTRQKIEEIRKEVEKKYPIKNSKGTNKKDMER